MTTDQSEFSFEESLYDQKFLYILDPGKGRFVAVGNQQLNSYHYSNQEALNRKSNEKLQGWFIFYGLMFNNRMNM